MVVYWLAALAAAQSQQATASLNPHAAELFDRDAVLRSWAVRQFDTNGDGWLTLYEAQPALARFKHIADANGDGRVTVREFEEAKALLLARSGSNAAQVVVIR